MSCETQSYADQVNNKRQPSKELESYITYLTRGTLGSTNNNINNLIRIKHRRKNNQNDVRKSLFPIWKKCSYVNNT